MALYSTQIQEEELKNKVACDWFAAYDTTQIIGKIDFSVAVPQKDGKELFDQEYLLWAEAKRGVYTDLAPLLAQLVLTIGKARTFNQYMPPLFLGAFDAEKIALVPYLSVSDIFYINDFNWNVTSSNTNTREFMLVLERVREQLAKRDNLWVYDWQKDERELQRFIKLNFIVSNGRVNKVCITPNNFAAIFNRWSEQVAPTIAVEWDRYKKDYGIIQADFFYADIFSKDNESLVDSLKVLLNRTEYRLKEQIQGRFFQEVFVFRDGQQAHLTFWNRYQRPPQNKYRKLLLDRRDLLVPPDVRERKGAFFTPNRWVDLSQQYLAEYLGEDWQEHYYVWDCCAGTGNLLHGLYNKYSIYASTLDDADVRVMKTQKNLLESHVFQFDFLNDDLQSEKVPASLRKILQDPKKREKLVIYINPPYAEADNRKGEGRRGVAESMIHQKYGERIGKAKRELFAQFFIRIYCEIPGAVLAEFSTLKILQASNFEDFRNQFCPKLEKAFIVPADTFDNVKGQFPIGFMIWNSEVEEKFDTTPFDVYDSKGNLLGIKDIVCYDNKQLLNQWAKTFKASDKTPNSIATIIAVASDFQNQRLIRIENQYIKVPADNHHWQITLENLVPSCIYFAVRKVIPATWLNDRDQFLVPNDSWQGDADFQADCLAYTLFNNNIRSQCGTNHWIPFTEEEISASERFDSHFMSDFVSGKIKTEDTAQTDLFGYRENRGIIDGSVPVVFSPEARNVIDAGRRLWQYYHQQAGANPNASFYDIRRHFQGVKVTGKGKEMMNTDSSDAQYVQLIANLRQALKVLAKRIEPKVYEHGFLKV